MRGGLLELWPLQAVHHFPPWHPSSGWGLHCLGWGELCSPHSNHRTGGSPPTPPQPNGFERRFYTACKREEEGGNDPGDFSQSQLDEFVEKLLRDWDEEESVTDYYSGEDDQEGVASCLAELSLGLPGLFLVKEKI